MKQWQRMLLMLTLIFGVVAMHGLVSASHGSDATEHSAGHAVGPRPAMSLPMVVPDDDVMSAVSAVAHASDQQPSPPAMLHDLLHLCLAVLAGIAAAVLVTLSLGRAARPDSPPALSWWSAGAPSRPPPRTAVRLAQLCVLRN